MAAARIAVVGGGLAGLRAAWALKDAGRDVELFERSRLLGGRATSFQVDGHVVDNGQHVFLACCTQFLDFMHRLDMTDAMYLQDRFDVIAYAKNGKRSRLRAAALPAPMHLLASFVGYAHLSLRGKVGVARALLVLRLRPKDARPDQSFAQWLRQNGQSGEAVRGFWEPFMVPALNAPLERMNAAEAAFVISTAFFSSAQAARLGFSKVPLAQIMERAAAGLDVVHRSSAVTSVEPDACGVTIETMDERFRFDAAVIAVPPDALVKLLRDPAAVGIPPLSAYEPFPIADVHLWHDKGSLDFDFAALLDSPVQWIFQKAPGYLCCSMSAAGAAMTRSNQDLAADAWREVTTALPQLSRASLRNAAATRSPNGTYLAAPGTLRPSAQTALPTLAIAGAWTATGWPDTMESAVRSGNAAARVLLNDATTLEGDAGLRDAVCAP